MNRTNVFLKFNIIILFFITLFSCSEKEPIDKPKDPNDSTQVVVDTFKVANVDDLVFYEVNFRAFGPDFNFSSVSNQLDSIKELGVNVIWLMPIHPIGEINRVGAMGSPYSVKDYFDVNPELGTIDDLKKFVKEAHKRNMAVILDWVANHTAWDNDWINNTDWYTQDNNGNIISPPGTNWKDVADLNFNNPDMRLEMIKAMKFWITTANIDGFRCDAADFVPYSFWKQAIDSLKKLNKNLILLAEGARNDHFSAGFQVTYAWDFYGKLVNIFSKSSSASEIFLTNAYEYNGLISGKHKLRYITNHDEYAWTASVTEKYLSSEGSLAAFVATAFMSPVILIYSGQEIAESNKIPFFSVYPLNWNKNYNIKSMYRYVMRIRNTLQSVKKGTTKSFSHSDIIAFQKIYNNEKILVLVNTRNNISTITLPDAFIADDITNLLTNNKEKLEIQQTLQPFEYKIFKY